MDINIGALIGIYGGVLFGQLGNIRRHFEHPLLRYRRSQLKE